MMRSFNLFFACIWWTISLQAQDYKKAWDHLNTNERDEAAEILEPKVKSGTANLDEYLTFQIIKSFSDQSGTLKEFSKHIRKADTPYPYIYSLWFTDPVAGSYGFKENHQLDLLNYLINTTTVHGTLQAAAHYSLGHHYLSIRQFAQVAKENTKMGVIQQWQFVGPFNNVSGSGFNKNYEPIKDTSNATFFSSADKAPIKWFTPPISGAEGWVFPGYFISLKSNGLAYAQTFVKSPVEQDVFLCTGFTGNLKAWVNDQLIISVPEEKKTELDTYNSKCHLNAGYNRILIQLGYDEEESPNFIVRLTDNNYSPITNLSISPEPQAYKRINGENLKDGIPHFAETYFKQKVEKEPENLLNYILLNKVYLRNKHMAEARKVIEKAIEKAPNNSILKLELLQCLIQENNRIRISELVEYFKEKDINSLLSYSFRIDKLKDEEKYQEALDLLEKRIQIYGIDASSYDEKIQLLAKLNNVPPLIATIEEAYRQYPAEANFANYMFNIEKMANKDTKKAIKTLEKFLERNFNYELSKILINEYFNQNKVSKGYALFREMIDVWPYDMTLRENVLNEYTNQQLYQDANELCNIILKQKPYSGYYYEKKAGILAASGKNADAISTYQQALTFQPTLYEARDKQRVLQNKKPLHEIAPHESIDSLIQHTGKNTENNNHDYYFLLEDNLNIIYPEGGREHVFTAAIKILNQRGIDHYKETQISFDSGTESLVIEDAQLIKKDGKKIKPEINENQIVWTGLEKDDIIYVKYRKKLYLSGKLAQEYYDKFTFGGFAPTELSRFSLIIPKSRKFNHKMINGELEPEISEFENYQLYVWEKKDIAALKEESYMPSAEDILPTLHLSTIEDWNEIAQWYSDLVYSKIGNDYEVVETYQQLFPEEKTKLPSHEKAKIIYNYILKNISYSSVSFRQNGLIPQKASKTVNTRLGDCKDLSTVFISLANLSGLKANLVLVDTRRNGKTDVLLPSFEFNHCIVKYYDENNQGYYLELTNNYLPFRSLPHNLYQVLTLDIPAKDDHQSKSQLIPLNTEKKTIDKITTKVRIDVIDNKIKLKSNTIKIGSLTSGLRSKYKSLSQEKIYNEMQESISKSFTNSVKINNVSFTGLNDLTDSVNVNIDCEVPNEIKKLGSVSALKIPYTDVIVSADPFNLENRNYNFEYWNYEYNDAYETVIEVKLPLEKKFTDIPKSEVYTFKNIRYSITYRKVDPNTLEVVRKAKIDRDSIQPADYSEFKEFVSKIINQESSYIGYQ